MSIEEQLQEEREYKRYYNQHLDNEFVRLTNLDMNTPMPITTLLRMGAVPYYVNDMRFLIVKLKGNYFDFVKEGEYYFKW